MEYKRFSPAVCEKLDYYVYILRDPRNNEIFYVGKGINNRVFAHVEDASREIIENARLDRIRAIHADGQKVDITIHRHGLTEKEAFEVEGALIDLLGLPALSNKVVGHHARYRGQMTYAEITAEYDALIIPITIPVIFIIINKQYKRRMTDDDLYQATRKNWKIGKRRDKAQYAFSVSNGLVRQVYKIEKWHPSEEPKGRWYFEGHIAEEMGHYIGSDIRQYLIKGAQNPILYINC
ncbi:MAG: hypothetical protein SFZ02_00860 [bacterium]|nr:hypothetical protein [bacterium]